jgi:hypothetical protein
MMAEAENVQEDSAKKTVQDILERRRSFMFEDLSGEPQEYFIADPTGEDIRKSDWNYAKVFNQAMADGFPTHAQMLEILEERGIISQEYHTEVERVRIGLAASLFRLENMREEDVGYDEKEREGAAVEVAEFRDKLFSLNQKVNGPLGNTCENMAEDARTEYLTSRIIQTKDGSRLWKDFDEFRREENTGVCVKSRLEVMLWLQGLDSNFLENTPEQAALRDIAQRRLDEVLSKSEEGTLAESEESVEEPAVEEPKTEPVEAEELEIPDKPKKKAVRKKTAAKRKPGRPKGSKAKKEEPPKDE